MKKPNTTTSTAVATVSTAASFVAAIKKRITTKQPQGWFSRDQVAQELGKSPNMANIILKDLCKRGIAERKKWSYLTEDLGTKTVYVYKVKH